jgi:transcriptional regulator with GAF, ATPase, and Fis domain
MVTVAEKDGFSPPPSDQPIGSPVQRKPPAAPPETAARYRTRFHVRLHVIIPVIFGGIASLSGIVTYRLAQFYLQHGSNPTMAVTLWLLSCSVFGFLCGLFVVRVILGPVERFVRRAEDLSVLKTAVPPDGTILKSKDEISHISQVFEQVTEVLSRVEARERFPGIVGESRAIRGVLVQTARVAPTDSTVLLLGESGTGKELIAEALHAHSLRKGPFVKLNCAAIPEGLLESELFGHEKGAFTGALARKKGKFEAADRGTLFLDEIGDMALPTQAKILRVIQEREFERVGGNQPIRCDVRLIVATNKDLEEMVKKELFREDLLYRIKVFSILLPPLRGRKEDIPLLAEYFLATGRQKEKNLVLSEEALQLLLSYSWPGNVRQLQNVIERAAVMCRGSRIEPSDLPAEVRGPFSLSAYGNGADAPFSIDTRLRDMEKAMILEALRRANGLQVKAAEILGINQRSLWHRVKKHGIDVRSLKNGS